VAQLAGDLSLAEDCAQEACAAAVQCSSGRVMAFRPILVAGLSRSRGVAR
jgi:hypothetical protein